MFTTRYMQALSDDTRLRTFRILGAHKPGLCVAELVDILRKPQYAVSRSLGELRKAGLVNEERKGKLVFYSHIGDSAVRALGDWVLSYCTCELDGVPVAMNPDGSGLPGSDPCAYDIERLRWRLSMRENGEKVVLTYSDQALTRDDRTGILFVCVHNSARSQLAEAYARMFAGDSVFVESAGLRPGKLNPYVVKILAEEGIDIAGKPTRSVIDLYRGGNTYQWVITVCSREAERDCPVFPGPVRRLSWPFEDPSRYEGTEDEILAMTRKLAGIMKTKVREFIDTLR